MQTLRANGGEEFILVKSKKFCKKKSIKIKYAIPYIYKENSIAK